jgi:hypothetical protein
MATNLKAAFAIPGTVTVGGREFVVPQPSASDLARVHDRMREIASRACVSPLLAVNAIAKELEPGVAAEAIRAAVAMGSGGGVEPTREAVMRAYDSLDGVRWRLWYSARKTDPGLTQAAVNELVTDENRFEVADALFTATNPAAGPDAPKAPPGGAS